eukprot:TRINITY_DN228_c0_g1_i4.p1 TRINITY_DN228_c0_g1~~TRINITY_DN228_c0_g1_i4.p1  ORF type:complete len:453 (+),score=185.26 TRINITY_DN228_c0_g1_i4:140-1360(+)
MFNSVTHNFYDYTKNWAQQSTIVQNCSNKLEQYGVNGFLNGTIEKMNTTYGNNVEKVSQVKNIVIDNKNKVSQVLNVPISERINQVSNLTIIKTTQEFKQQTQNNVTNKFNSVCTNWVYKPIEKVLIISDHLIDKFLPQTNEKNEQINENNDKQIEQNLDEQYEQYEQHLDEQHEQKQEQSKPSFSSLQNKIFDISNKISHRVQNKMSISFQNFKPKFRTAEKIEQLQQNSVNLIDFAKNVLDKKVYPKTENIKNQLNNLSSKQKIEQNAQQNFNVIKNQIQLITNNSLQFANQKSFDFKNATLQSKLTIQFVSTTNFILSKIENNLPTSINNNLVKITTKLQFNKLWQFIQNQSEQYEDNNDNDNYNNNDNYINKNYNDNNESIDQQIENNQNTNKDNSDNDENN